MLAEAAATAGLALTSDPRPELVRFIRSDQFSFVRHGIPGLNLKPGSRSLDPAIDGPAAVDTFLREHYHQSGDDLQLSFDAGAASRFGRTAMLLGVLVANADERPQWNDGDFFGQRFGAAPDRTGSANP
jgi:hypothetical protein